MRFLLYNVRYCAGTGSRFHLPVPYGGYLKRTHSTLEKISSFIRGQEPDVVGLIEVDSGSYRSQRVNQAEQMARDLGHFHLYQSKYGLSSMARHLPLLKKQGNAFLTDQKIQGEKTHYFKSGVKRLMFELELKDLTIFLVHLSLKFRHRAYQLREIYTVLSEIKKPHIVAGDFNVFRGDHELQLFLAATGLSNANQQNWPTYPSRAPKRQLDFILCSRGIKVTRFDIPHVSFSDHLPLVCDFEV